jgi:hypothetical protein
LPEKKENKLKRESFTVLNDTGIHKRDLFRKQAEFVLSETSKKLFRIKLADDSILDYICSLLLKSTNMGCKSL